MCKVADILTVHDSYMVINSASSARPPVASSMFSCTDSIAYPFATGTVTADSLLSFLL